VPAGAQPEKEYIVDEPSLERRGVVGSSHCRKRTTLMANNTRKHKSCGADLFVRSIIKYIHE
jgi:hypothetical protein